MKRNPSKYQEKTLHTGRQDLSANARNRVSQRRWSSSRHADKKERKAEKNRNGRRPEPLHPESTAVKKKTILWHVNYSSIKLLSKKHRTEDLRSTSPASVICFA